MAHKKEWDIDIFTDKIVTLNRRVIAQTDKKYKITHLIDNKSKYTLKFKHMCH